MTELLSTVLSQDTAVTALRRALAQNSVHHAYLFEGPPGVGKELVALGLAQALVCERRAPGGDRACGECSACKRSMLGPEPDFAPPRHPDVVILERNLYEPARIGRRTPETQDISIDQVRTLVLARAAFGPHEGKAKVFIIRRAEELSTSAANALLKTLEEPGDRTHFILLSAQANDLLPTVRSRTMHMRFGSLPAATIVQLLVASGKKADVAERAAQLAGGSMQEARIAADPELSAARDAFIERILGAIAKKDRGAGYAFAEEAKKDKAKLERDLISLAGALDTRMRAHAQDATDGTNARDRAAAFAEAYDLVMLARGDLLGNNSPQLVFEALYFKLADVLA
jgi:DNA polymerase-3 subunit delta'